MTREIKYRAWDKINKKIKEVKSIEWLNPEFNDEPYMIGFESAVYSPSTPDCPGEWNEETLWRKASEVELMQYSGLFDKNNNEVCEEDIIAFPEKSSTEYIVKFGKVEEFGEYPVIDAMGFFLKSTGRYNINDPDISRISEFIIIGNRFERDDLLKEGGQ